MTDDRLLSRRSVLAGGVSGAVAAFGASAYVNADRFGVTTPVDRRTVWQHYWGDATLRRFAPVALPPSSLLESWSTTAEDPGPVCSLGPGAVYRETADGLTAFERSNAHRGWTVDERWSFPAVAGGTVLFQSGQTISTVDAASGKIAWQGELAVDGPILVPFVHDGELYADHDGWVYTVDPATGLFRRDIGNLPGRLLVGSGDHLLWFSRSRGPVLTTLDGEIEWTVGKSFSDVRTSSDFVGVADRFAVTIHGDDTAGVVAFGREAGAQQWKRNWDRTEFVASLTADRSTIYATVRHRGEGSRIHAIDADSGDQLWTTPELAVEGEPLVTLNRVFVPTTDGVAILDSATGDVATRLRPDSTVTSLAAVEGALAIGTDDRTMLLEESP